MPAPAILLSLTTCLFGSVHVTPARAPAEPAGADVAAPHRHTVYLNFVGGTYTFGNNAAEGQAACIPHDGYESPPYTGTQERALDIVHRVEAALAPFGIRVAYKARPPKHLPYSEIVIGGTSEGFGVQPNKLASVCAADCGDAWWRDTTFVFSDETDLTAPLVQAALVAAASSWGLALHPYPSYILSATVALGEDGVWADECTALAPYPDACPEQHAAFCPAGEQNDVAELLAIFGPNSVDETPPTVALLAPADGAALEPGVAFTVTAEVADDLPGFGWRLEIPELGAEYPAYDGETSWEITAEPGVYTLRVEAIDHDRNVGSAEATIYVGVEPPPAPEPDTTGAPTTGELPEASSSGEAPIEGSSSGDADISSGDAGDDAGGDELADAGCACSQGQARAPSPLWLLALAGWRRRSSRPRA